MSGTRCGCVTRVISESARTLNEVSVSYIHIREGRPSFSDLPKISQLITDRAIASLVLSDFKESTEENMLPDHLSPCSDLGTCLCCPEKPREQKPVTDSDVGSQEAHRPQGADVLILSVHVTQRVLLALRSCGRDDMYMDRCGYVPGVLFSTWQPRSPATAVGQTEEKCVRRALWGLRKQPYVGL